MKKIFLSTLIIFCSLIVIAQKNKGTDSDVRSVTVFLNGAQVHRVAPINLKSGVNEIRFTNLSSSIDGNSIRVEGSNQYTIVSVSHQQNYMNTAKDNPRVRNIKDSIKLVKFKLDLRKSVKEVYVNEKSMLLANKSIAGENAGLDVEDLLDMADFLRERLTKIEFQLLEIDTDIKKMNDEIRKLNNQLNEISSGKHKNTSEIIVKVTSARSQHVAMAFDYMVRNAKWEPIYDVRVDDLSGNIRLHYKANVSQQTGIDWQNVKVKLSTGNPSQSNNKPNVYPWVLRYQPEYSYRSKGNYKKEAAMSNSMYDMEEAAEEAPMAEPISSADEAYAWSFSDATSSTADYTTVVNDNVQTTFDVSIPYDIPSDGDQYLVDIQQYTVPATFEHFAAPKFDRDAFLLANITGWEKYNLLPGNSNIYFEGTYVGQAYINTRQTKDTLSVSAGRDKGVVVERKKVRDYTKPAIIGSNKKLTLAIEINVRNTKAQSISLSLEDQVPISSNKEIEIEVLEVSGAKHNTQTGKLSWNLTLEPGGSKSYRIVYSVKYPKHQNISNL